MSLFVLLCVAAVAECVMLTLGDFNALSDFWVATGCDKTNRCPKFKRGEDCVGQYLGCSENGRVTRINLDADDAEIKLSGTLPSSIGALTALQKLILSKNAISGTIPSSIALLTNLSVLNLKTNAFSGTIPTEIAQLTGLERLSLAENNFTGKIPTRLGTALINLVEFDVYHNSLTGDAPAFVGSFAIEAVSGPSKICRMQLDDVEETNCLDCGSVRQSTPLCMCSAAMPKACKPPMTMTAPNATKTVLPVTSVTITKANPELGSGSTQSFATTAGTSAKVTTMVGTTTTARDTTTAATLFLSASTSTSTINVESSSSSNVTTINAIAESVKSSGTRNRASSNDDDDNGALIGGIVGGTIAVLLLVGVVVAVLWRRQRAGDAAAAESSATYGQVPRLSNQYDGIGSPLD